MSVEWRHGDGTDSLVLVNDDAMVVSEIPRPDAAALKDYLAVTADLDTWRTSMAWSPVGDDRRDPQSWGKLVFSRDDRGDVTFVDPELFWDGVYRWFRSRGVDYNT